MKTNKKTKNLKETTVEHIKINKNGWRNLKGKKHLYRFGKTKHGTIWIENEEGEGMEIPYEKLFNRKESIDQFWEKNF